MRLNIEVEEEEVGGWVFGMLQRIDKYSYFCKLGELSWTWRPDGDTLKASGRRPPDSFIYLIFSTGILNKFQQLILVCCADISN